MTTTTNESSSQSLRRIRRFNRYNTNYRIDSFVNNNVNNNVDECINLNPRPIENCEIYPLVNKIWDLEIKISNLKCQNRIETEASLTFKTRAEKSEKYIENIQEILFENSEIIPEWIYVKLMNSLIGK